MRKWIIVEDSVEKAEGLITEILQQFPQDQLAWIYPYSRAYPPPRLFTARLGEHSQVEKVSVKMIEGEKCKLDFYWCTNEATFERAFLDSIAERVILLLEVQVDALGGKPEVVPILKTTVQAFFKRSEEHLLATITTATNPFVIIKQLELNPQQDSHCYIGKYSFTGLEAETEYKRFITTVHRQWANHFVIYPFSDLLKDLGQISSAVLLDPTEGSIPLSLQYFCRWIDYDLKDFLDTFAPNTPRSELIHSPVLQALVTFFYGPEKAPSLLAALLVARGAFRKVFSTEHPDNQHFVEVIQSCRQPEIFRASAISPPQHFNSNRDTLQALYEMMKEVFQRIRRYDSEVVLLQLHLSSSQLVLELNLNPEQLRDNLIHAYTIRLLGVFRGEHFDKNLDDALHYGLLSSFSDDPENLDWQAILNFPYFKISGPRYHGSVERTTSLVFSNAQLKEPAAIKLVEEKIVLQRDSVDLALDYAERLRVRKLNQSEAAFIEQFPDLASDWRVIQKQWPEESLRPQLEPSLNKITRVCPNFQEAWNLLAELYTQLDVSEVKTELANALDRSTMIQDVIDFENNVDHPFRLKSIQMNGLPFFADKKVAFSKRVNLIIGKNAYGKTYLLRAIACLMTKEKVPLQQYFDGKVADASIGIELEYAKGDIRTISAANAQVVESGTGLLPLLAIPDLRFIDRTQVDLKPLDLDREIREEGAWHFIHQHPYRDVLQGSLYQLAADHYHSRSDESIVNMIMEIINTLISENSFSMHVEPTGESGHLRFIIKPIGTTESLPLQRASQGTLSVICIFTMIFQFLRRLYPQKPLSQVPQQSAVVIIEELDAHLHPSWQQKIVGLLLRTFPQVQFFISGHSPLLVAGRSMGEVLVMRREQDDRVSLNALQEDFVGMTTPDLYRKVFDIEDEDENYRKILRESLKADVSEADLGKQRFLNLQHRARKEDHEFKLKLLKSENEWLALELKGLVAEEEGLEKEAPEAKPPRKDALFILEQSWARERIALESRIRELEQQQLDQENKSV